MRIAALFILLAATTIVRADVLPPYRQWPDECAAAKADDRCRIDGKFPGKCALLSSKERGDLELPRLKRCQDKTNIGEPCLVCVTEAYRASGAAKKPAETPKK